LENILTEPLAFPSKGKADKVSARGRQPGLEGEEDFRQVILSIPAAVYTTDREGRITLYNNCAAEMWGRRPEIGKDMWCGSWRIFEPDGTPLPHDKCPMAVTLSEGVGVRGQEIVVERPDGSRACVLPYPEPLRNKFGEIVGAVNMLVDISDRKIAEEQIQELNRCLEARVADRTAQLVDRTAQLEAFCYSIAHDFRQYTRGVSLNARFVNELVPHLDQEVADTLDRLVSDARHLEQLLADLLAYARSSSQAARKEHIDLTSLILHLQAQLTETYPDAEFHVQPLLAANGDPALIGVVFQNLMDNACKYATIGTRPVIEVGCVDGVFYVRDNGIGFDMAYVDKVFEPFERLHTNGNIPGSGIGLASVKKAIERHAGRIWASSCIGRGSTFHLTLPD